ncbi:cytoplasmic translation machinery associated protein, putative [Plasmodium relictum]|uniref:Cytoplasmic translation machinery associated protein, putative n=1 Tax=Plasmodium relictum TaxID=85471 RepID=A0A1J1HD33_PLARL|nr:cytoplasmic translation machinery associated protein, putative [Plasmodium relictum]CRH02864.1 cytoplasmic translation machinery associated protein, putative [Plasmodium relictum]
MPPKKENKKLEKEKQKIVEDKTFGLKNKNKSKSVQRYIKGVQQQVFQQKKKNCDEKRKEEKEKEKLNQQKLLLNSIYQKTEKVKKINESSTYDPKKSKEAQKIDIYTDIRDGKNEKEDDTIDKWDIHKLTEVINIRHKNINKTDIICKYFLSAVENKQYGWFWVCPNGGDNCKYKHCLPQGYILKKQETPENEKEERPLEDIIEEERMKYINNGTPVTLELFKKWISERTEKKKLKKEEQKEKDKSEKKNKNTMLSGKELFSYDPTLFVDDDNAANTNEYDDLFYDDEEEKKENIEKKNDINGEIKENENDKREDEVPINSELFINELDDLDQLD